MKQKKISYWLKGLDIVLALMVLTFLWVRLMQRYSCLTFFTKLTLYLLLLLLHGLRLFVFL